MRLPHSIYICVLVLLFLGGALFAQKEEEDKSVKGLSSGFGKVKVENLRPGQTYHLSKLYTPIRVLNASEMDLKLKMELLKSQPEGLEPGFEPIDSLTWALLEKMDFFVPAFEMAESDLTIHVPDEPDFWGKKYQLNIWSRTVGESGLAVGLMHVFLFTTLPLKSRETKGNEEPKEASYFSIDPFEILMGTVPMYETINVAEWSGQKFVLTNPNSKPHRFRLRVLRPDEWEAKLPESYELCSYSEWLKFKETEFVVNANTSKSIDIELTIPSSLSRRGKKYLFVVRAEMLDGDIPVSLDSRIYIDITKKFKREWLYK